MTNPQAISLITEKQHLGIQPGLSRIKALLEKMGNPQDKIKVIHIAGTNGKGTVAATIARELAETGLKVGLFTSPWVIDYREQIQINGKWIEEKTFSRYIERWQANDCTEFEFLTAIMYRYFADERVDYAVVECGMGGAGDATNAEKNNLSVITSVSLDHTDFLGATLEEIAEEKAGVLRENGKCVLYPNAGLEDIFREKCAALCLVEEQGDYIKNLCRTVELTLREVGIYQTVNQLVSLPARQEKIGGILLDGGHNVSAAKALVPKINNETALIGMMRDKDVKGYLSIIAPKCKKIVATAPNHLRAMPAEELAVAAKKFCPCVEVAENPQVAVKQNDFTLICGAFYLAREIRNLL